jgi:protocatechuate 3,4-dioxygenase beta subunit
LSQSRAYTRRRFITQSASALTTAQLQSAARALGFQASTPVCQLTAEQEVGPFYIEGEMIRADLREDKTAIPLLLNLVLLDSRNCRPLENAAIEVSQWGPMRPPSCYANERAMIMVGPGVGLAMDPSMGPSGSRLEISANGASPDAGGRRPPARALRTMEASLPPYSEEQIFLRGIQLADEVGKASFQTLWPGFYPRRNHIGLKVRVGGHANGRLYTAGHTSYTGQISFPYDLAIALMAGIPGKSSEIHCTTRPQDRAFNGQNGKLCLAQIALVEPGDLDQGLRACLIASVDPTAVPIPTRR